MTTALISFLQVLTKWLLDLRRNKKTNVRPRQLHDPNNSFSMDNVVESFESSQSSLHVPDGVAHWEERRRKWTSGHHDNRTGTNGDTVIIFPIWQFRSSDRIGYGQR